MRVGKRKLSDERIQEVVGQVLAGEPFATIAANAGISTDTLRSYCRGSGVDTQKRSRLVRHKQVLTGLQLELVKDVLVNGPVETTDFSARTGHDCLAITKALQCPVFLKEPDGYHLDWTLRSWWEE